MTNRLSRRQMLAVSGGSVASVAGCTNPFAEDGIRIGRVLVSAVGACTLRVELDRDGEEIVARWFEFDAEGSEHVEATWDSEPAVHTLRYVGLDFERREGIVTSTLTRDSLNDSPVSRGDLRDEECVWLRIIANPDRGELEHRIYPPDFFDGECPADWINE